MFQPTNQLIITRLVVQKPSWKMMEFVNGKDDIPYMMENKSHVWNHQQDYNHQYIG